MFWVVSWIRSVSVETCFKWIWHCRVKGAALAVQFRDKKSSQYKTVIIMWFVLLLFYVYSSLVTHNSWAPWLTTTEQTVVSPVLKRGISHTESTQEELKRTNMWLKVNSKSTLLSQQRNYIWGPPVKYCSFNCKEKRTPRSSVWMQWSHEDKWVSKAELRQVNKSKLAMLLSRSGLVWLQSGKIDRLQLHQCYRVKTKETLRDTLDMDFRGFWDIFFFWPKYVVLYVVVFPDPNS